MSGLEAFDALLGATHQLPYDSRFDINPADFCDLAKLSPEMLEERGFFAEDAERASGALFRDDVSVLGRSLGLLLVKRRWATRLSSP